MKDPQVVYVSTYDPNERALGGASWVGGHILNELKASILAFFVADLKAQNPVDLELRGNSALAARTLKRIVKYSEPYQQAKFRASPGWEPRVRALQRIVDEHPNAKVVTDQWPALLLAADARVDIDVHIAHNVDATLSEQFDPLVLRLPFNNPARMKASERKLLKLPAKVATLSRTDAARLEEWGVTATPVDLGLYRKETTGPSVAGIGFVGKSSWPPNKQAAEVLLREIYPAVKKRLDFNAPPLIFAGRGYDERFASRWPDSTALGKIAKIEEFYSKVSIVPVPRLGTTTGISVKMLEALEFGCECVVPSSLAYDADVSAYVHIADTPSEIADAIAGLCKNTRPPRNQAGAFRTERTTIRQLLNLDLEAGESG